MPARWVFVEGPKQNEWTWRTIAPDGIVERVSHSFTDYGAVMLDAIKQGFRPRREHWVVITPHGTTHFKPNQPVVAHPDGDGYASTRKPDLNRIRDAAIEHEPTKPHEDDGGDHQGNLHR
jgi:hypothetical protein